MYLLNCFFDLATVGRRETTDKKCKASPTWIMMVEMGMCWVFPPGLLDPSYILLYFALADLDWLYQPTPCSLVSTCVQQIGSRERKSERQEKGLGYLFIEFSVCETLSLCPWFLLTMPRCTTFFSFLALLSPTTKCTHTHTFKYKDSND